MDTTASDGQPWEAPEDTFAKQRAGILDDKGHHATTDESLYAILNLPKTATSAEIKDRYRELAVVLHPDKAPAKHRSTAESKFREVKRAYEVLIDPERRAAYDALGAEALDLPEWRLRQRNDFEKTRDDFARMAAHRVDMAADRLFASTSNSMDAVVDASPLFSSERGEGGSLVQVRQLSLATGFKSQVAPATTVGITGSLQKGEDALHEGTSEDRLSDRSNQNSSQGMMGTIQHQYSPRISFTARARLIQPHHMALGAGYVINPYTRLDVLRQEHADTIRERREEAEEVMELMREHVTRRVEAESKTDAITDLQFGSVMKSAGLIIEAAWYGRINAFSTEPSSSSFTPLPDVDNSGDLLADVRVPMQNFVNKSQLVIPGGRSKAGLLGFWDPCWGQRKRLFVRYRFRGRKHEAIVEDLEALLIPMRDCTAPMRSQ
ncbi:hypothetical protein FRB98_004149 [Tulasnella sp. 332]|nr:hypothetical protein FRB98_004149 [Tulasnella sp. 332]